MAEDREALLAHYMQMRKALLASIDGLGDEQLLDPSIDGWAGKDHLAHIALWDDIRADEITRISAGHDSAWRTTEDQATAFIALAYALRRSFSLEQARWELMASRQRLLEAIAAATPRGLDAALYGDASLRTDHEATHAGWIRRWRQERGI